MRAIAIYGAGGMGREMLLLIQQINRAVATWEVAGFFDDGVPAGTGINGFSVLGDLLTLNQWANPLAILVAVGKPDVKRAIVDQISNPLVSFPTLIHPSVALTSDNLFTVGVGSILSAGTILTTNVTMGRHVFVNLNCTIGHDAVLGDFCALMPGVNVSGEVILEAGRVRWYRCYTAKPHPRGRGHHHRRGRRGDRRLTRPLHGGGCARPANSLSLISALIVTALSHHPMFDIYLSPPHESGSENTFAQEAVRRNWNDPTNPDVQAFEQALSRKTGAAHVAALSSGTAGLHLALVLLGVGPGDDVLCQSSTYVATANPILYQGATPVFIDSEPTTWNMCPDALETALRDRYRRGKRPKAVLVVDSYGMPAQYEKLLQVCATYEIPLIEDAAEALGSTYKGTACGTLGRLGVWSFNRNKIITTTGGGALVSTDKKLTEKARFLAAQAREPTPYYLHTEPGFNYQLSNISAGIGRAQLRVLDERVAQRRANYGHYQQLLGHLPGIGFQAEPPGGYSNRWLTVITIDPALADDITPDDLRRALQANRIEARLTWNPMHRQPLFAGCPVYETGMADRLFATGLCLPSGSALAFTDQERVVDAIQQVWYERAKAGAV